MSWNGLTSWCAKLNDMQLGCQLTIGKSLLSKADDNAFHSRILWPLQ